MGGVKRQHIEIWIYGSLSYTLSLHLYCTCSSLNNSCLLQPLNAAPHALMHVSSSLTTHPLLDYRPVSCLMCNSSLMFHQSAPPVLRKLLTSLINIKHWFTGKRRSLISLPPQSPFSDNAYRLWTLTAGLVSKIIKHYRGLGASHCSKITHQYLFYQDFRQLLCMWMFILIFFCHK